MIGRCLLTNFSLEKVFPVLFRNKNVFVKFVLDIFYPLVEDGKLYGIQLSVHPHSSLCTNPLSRIPCQVKLNLDK